MTENYLVPASYGESEFIEKRSRFIGQVWTVEAESEAQAHIEAARKQYYDARHNVYAYIIRSGGAMRYSDDGEPSGTAGQPVLNVFRQEKIYNVCCVVTRYFGGILLGTGGLTRAYSTTAKQALEKAGVMRMALWKRYLIPCAYNRYERIRRLLEDYEAVTEDVAYAEDVTFSVLLREDCAEDFLKALEDVTAGSVHTENRGETFRGVRIR